MGDGLAILLFVALGFLIGYSFRVVAVPSIRRERNIAEGLREELRESERKHTEERNCASKRIQEYAQERVAEERKRINEERQRERAGWEREREEHRRERREWQRKERR